MLAERRTSLFNFWYNAKETGSQIIGIALGWVVLVHGVFVFLLSLLITGPYLFSLNQNAVALAWYLFLMSLASSTLPPIALVIVPQDVNIDNPVMGYIFGGYAGGVVGSVVAIALKIWLEQPPRAILLTPLSWSSLIAVFAVAIGIICMLVGMAHDLSKNSKHK